MENFCKFQKNMEDNVKTLCAVAYDNRKKHLGRKFVQSCILYSVTSYTSFHPHFSNIALTLRQTLLLEMECTDLV